MIKRESSFDPNIYQSSVPEAHGAAPEIENKLNNPQFLEKQFRLPKEQWDEQFRALVHQKSEENQRMIKDAEESLGREFKESPQETSAESPEVLRRETFERYVKGLGLGEEDLKGKRVLDLGCHEGEFVQQLIKENITPEAYGLEANEEVVIKEGIKDHILRGNFAKELPKKNLDYIVSVGAVSNYISEGEDGVAVIEDTIKSSLDSLKENGEVRIYPIQEAQENSELVGLIESRKDWGNLVEKIFREGGVTCSIEPRAVKVIGKNNDIILESVLVIKKNKVETQESEKSGKEKQWEKIVEDVDRTVDGLGKKIEKGIKSTIVGLNAVGVNTCGSCHGHTNRGRITPWVDIEAPNPPAKFFEEPKEITKEIYEQYSISEDLWKKQEQLTEEFEKEKVALEKLNGAEYVEAINELREKLLKKHDFSQEEIVKFENLNRDMQPKETPEYITWKEENKKMRLKVSQLLEEFYQDRDVPENVKIQLSKDFNIFFTIYSGQEDYESRGKNKIKKEKEELKSRLELYRAEFKEFAEFLKEKFFSGTDENPEKTKQESNASPEEKEKRLKRDLLGIQLQYAQRLFEKKILSPSDNINTESIDFKQALEEFTDLSTIVRDAFLQRTGKDFGSEENYKEFEKINQAVIEKVIDAYNRNPDNWMNGVDVLISGTINQLPEGGPLQEKGPEEFHAGVLRYSVGAGHGGLEDYGITPEDECIKTHLDPLFLQEDATKGKRLSELYREAYAIIAKEVKESYPNAKALVSESWLFDTNLAKETGLHTYPSGNENMFRGRTFWGQFINRGGKINEERVKQFLETGKPPFRVRSGYILIDEFMDKYGAKN